jgi:acyl-CoA thioesterase I
MNNRQIIAAAFLTLAVAGALFLREYGVFGAIESPKYTVKAHDFRPPPQDQPLRIAVLGTSLSAANDWPPALQSRLAACRTGYTKVSVTAEPGASSDWGLGVVDKVLAEKPNFLLIELAANDSSLLKGIAQRKSLKVHEDLLHRVHKAGVPVVLMTMNPAYGAKRIARPGQAAYHRMYRELAAANGLTLIDSWPYWQRMDAQTRKSAIPDGIHPTRDAAKKAMIGPIMSAIGSQICT